MTRPNVLPFPVLVFFAAGVLCGCERGGGRLRPAPDSAESAFAARLSAAHGDVERLDRALDAEILRLQSLLEEGLDMRRRMADFARHLQQKDERHEPLSGEELHHLNRHISHALGIAQRMFRVVDHHKYWLTWSDADFGAAGLVGLPVELRLKGTMLSLAGSLFLYDSYRLHVATLARHDKVRHQLDHGDRGYAIRAELLSDVTEEFLSVSRRLSVRRELRFYRENRDAAAARYGQSVTFLGLEQLIEQSPSRTYFETSLSALPTTAVPEHASTRLEMVRADLADFGASSMGTLSQFFGNTVGLVETRKGHLHGDQAVLAHLEARLQPGDVLLEKTPFRLTDVLIPGYWGHAAVWVGVERDLRDLGLWDDPVVRPHRAEIQAGRGVVEALRGGVVLSPMAHFLNIDDLAVLRERGQTRDRRVALIRRAFRQVGKAYDFNFDVETTDRIVCSELIYVVFTGIDWPTSRTLGRHTISPDNIAVKALNNGPFGLVLLYHDGIRVADAAPAVLDRLMKSSSSRRLTAP